MSDRSFKFAWRYFVLAAAIPLVLMPPFGQTQTVGQPQPGTQPPPAATTAAAPAAAAQGTAFKPEEMEAIVAPIALYPDALLAQIFMASTYPLEVVEAARWSKDHPDVKGDAVGEAVKDQTWDPSVKSLVAFPQVITMMNEKLDWTQKLGDAFLADQKGVMDAVQRLRNKAQAAGNLKSTKEMTVKTEPPGAHVAPTQPATTTAAAAPAPATQTIIIESKDPEVVYVPQYDPVVVYGAWSYPYYPPYYYYPPGYAAGAAFWSFTAGVIVGGALWGNCNWGGGDVDIDINRENNFTRNTNRETNRNTNRSGDRSSWQHDSSHRKGVGYRDSGTQQKYGRGGSQQATQAREQYRGRAEQGRDQMAREGVGNQRDLSGNQIGTRDTRSAQNRDVGGGQGRDLGGANPRDAGGGQRAGGNTASSRDLGSSSRGSSASSRDSSASRGSSASSRGSSASRGNSAFSGAGNGSSARASSSRGSASRSSAGMSRGGGGRRR